MLRHLQTSHVQHGTFALYRSYAGHLPGVRLLLNLIKSVFFERVVYDVLDQHCTTTTKIKVLLTLGSVMFGFRELFRDWVLILSGQ
jgi:hypothetical protein